MLPDQQPRFVYYMTEGEARAQEYQRRKNLKLTADDPVSDEQYVVDTQPV